MKKTLSTIMSLFLVLWLVAAASGGLNDRFSTIELTDIPNATSGTDIVTKTATQTLTNKTLTSPTVTGATITSPSVTSGTFTTSTLSGTTTFSGATLSGGATMSGTYAGGTYSSPTITTPTITGIDTTFNVSAHEYTTNDDWVMSASEAKSILLTVTSGSTATNIIAPDVSGRLYVLRNDTSPGGACTIKKSGGTGIAIASGKTATVIHNGSDYIRITADQTH